MNGVCFHPPIDIEFLDDKVDEANVTDSFVYQEVDQVEMPHNCRNMSELAWCSGRYVSCRVLLLRTERSAGVLRLIVEIESRGGEMKMTMDVRVCDIKVMVIGVVDLSDPGEIHRDRLAI